MTRAARLTFTALIAIVLVGYAILLLGMRDEGRKCLAIGGTMILGCSHDSSYWQESKKKAGD